MAALKAIWAVLVATFIAAVLGMIYDYFRPAFIPDPSGYQYMYPWFTAVPGFIAAVIVVLMTGAGRGAPAATAGKPAASKPAAGNKSSGKPSAADQVAGMPSFDFDKAREQVKSSPPAPMPPAPASTAPPAASTEATATPPAAPQEPQK